MATLLFANHQPHEPNNSVAKPHIVLQKICTHRLQELLYCCRPPQTSACWGPAHTLAAPGFLLTDIFIPWWTIQEKYWELWDSVTINWGRRNSFSSWEQNGSQWWATLWWVLDEFSWILLLTVFYWHLNGGNRDCVSDKWFTKKKKKQSLRYTRHTLLPIQLLASFILFYKSNTHYKQHTLNGSNRFCKNENSLKQIIVNHIKDTVNYSSLIFFNSSIFNFVDLRCFCKDFFLNIKFLHYIVWACIITMTFL